MTYNRPYHLHYFRLCTRHDRIVRSEPLFGGERATAPVQKQRHEKQGDKQHEVDDQNNERSASPFDAENGNEPQKEEEGIDTECCENDRFEVTDDGPKFVPKISVHGGKRAGND